MCFPEIECDVKDVKAVVAKLPADSPVLGVEFGAACLARFSDFASDIAEGSDLANAVLAAIPEKRQSVLGVTEETAAQLVDELGLAPLTAESFTALCRWAAAEDQLSLARGPVVARVLPAGLAQDGREIVEMAATTLLNATAAKREREAALEKLSKKCHAGMNPRGFRTCQREAQRAVGAILHAHAEAECHAFRTRCLDALAIAVTGYAEGAGPLAPRAAAPLARSLAGPADEQLSALCLASALAPWNAGALRELLPRVAELAGCNLFAVVQTAAVALLTQLAFRPELQAAVAGVLSDLRRLLPPHRALAPADRLDVHLLVLLLSAEQTPGGAVYPLVDVVETQGGLQDLAAALAASVRGQEYPVGSACFRAPEGLLRCVEQACRAGRASQLHDALPSALALLEEHPLPALRALRALVTSRRNAVDMVHGVGCRGYEVLQDLIADSHAFGDGETGALAAELLETVAQTLAAVPVFEAVDFDRLLSRDRTVHLRGVVAPDASLYCADADQAVELLGQYDVVCWDGSPPPLRGVIPEYTSSFTCVLERALEAHPLLVCAAFVADASAAEPWADVAASFPGRVLFFRAAPTDLAGALVAPAVPADTVVSIGLRGALRDDFAAVAAGEAACPSWTVFPAGDDSWGGMSLTTPCVLQDRRVKAVNGQWGLHFNEDQQEWLLD